MHAAFMPYCITCRSCMILILWHQSTCVNHAIPNESSLRSYFGMSRPQCILHSIHAWWIVIQIWFQSVSRLASKTLKFEHYNLVGTPHLGRQINWTSVSHHCSFVCGMCPAFSFSGREFCCQLPCSGEESLTAFCFGLRMNLRAYCLGLWGEDSKQIILWQEKRVDTELSWTLTFRSWKTHFSAVPWSGKHSEGKHNSWHNQGITSHCALSWPGDRNLNANQAVSS